jgi:hypothetical protein
MGINFVVVRCGCNECRGTRQREEKKGYTPSVNRILESETLNNHEKDLALQLYHNKRIARVETEYTVAPKNNLPPMEDLETAWEVGKGLAQIAHTDRRMYDLIASALEYNL